MHIEMTGREPVSLSAESAWEYLLDVSHIAACIPGYQQIKEVGPDHWQVIMKAPLGKLTLDITRPECTQNAMRLDVKGKIMLMGSFALTVKIQLYPDGNRRTFVVWSAIVDVQGALEAVGEDGVKQEIKSFIQQITTRLNAFATDQTLSAPRAGSEVPSPEPSPLPAFTPLVPNVSPVLMTSGPSSSFTLTSSPTSAVTRRLPWLWPCYPLAVIAFVLTANRANLYGLLIFTLLAFAFMLVEHIPEFLLVVTALAVWTLRIVFPASSEGLFWLAIDGLCVLLFATYSIWDHIKKPASQHSQWREIRLLLSEVGLPRTLGIGGLVAVLVILLNRYSNPGTSTLLWAGSVALILLALLVFWLGYLSPPGVFRELCNYTAGLLLSLVAVWEIPRWWHPTPSLDFLTLVARAYLCAVVVPLWMRSHALSGPTSFGAKLARRVVAMAGALLLVVPALVFSFNSVSAEQQLASVIILFTGSLFCLVLGLFGVEFLPQVGALLVLIALVRAITYVVGGGNPVVLWVVVIPGVVALIIGTVNIFRRRRRK